MRKVLIANRGEIAVRIARACRDAGLDSVAVYAEPDRTAPHVRAADEAFALGGDTPATSYLDIARVLRAAAESGADTVHPGYGFLSEQADFAQAVLDAGLIWVGPSPEAIRCLGNKATARCLAARAGLPPPPGTLEPVRGPADVLDFARQHGLPVAIKAVLGGGGRGIKVARTLDEIPHRYDSAVREAVAAFGSGECVVELFLDQARHVETQCLADSHGNVVVVSTRDCSLQRRHQKLVEEAPAPFLTDDQDRRLREASRAILRDAGYVGAGTCEFLVTADGGLHFLEVNTRLQVEHPVSEEVTGIDLVREQLRIAEGQPLGYPDPPVRGHSIEFRINAEDPGRDFLPAPGVVREFRPPAGPGVRLDTGIEPGSVIGPAWDSLLAKLVVTGTTRTEALRRARRALAEFTVTGVPTTIAFHRAVVDDPDFAGVPMRVHTRWIESAFDNQIPAYPVDAANDEDATDRGWETVVVEVGRRRVEIALPADLTPRRPAGVATVRRRSAPATRAVSGDVLAAPMQGTIVTVAVAEGQWVQAGELVFVLEAMKMEQPVTAHKAGTVTGLDVAPGRQVTAGAALCEIRS
ncbi:acetyl/propionyl/methylcrotonyl-CoA carboxylase subunit alpha [Micromonospora yangpuensis]|uniref:biotin carboxylase n=1 Tax=Micromonospora yangpuensis TaxID=683228 RepID=A0A1C6UG03_9ACTN|nr:biotin carboxylase N-terminal domain-containing protein [Micromonospora yangpuensis]GGM05561.1 acetyl-/propionyl-CoA carboxylase subunit alpha [Micromonospora yangpuensis]SCL52809.1 acetyl-CoA/propionyl-CoA carboxylase, biotin carboxylase, biotin carboxyl carrier protein [Micromonospora yangpuensis]